MPPAYGRPSTAAARAGVIWREAIALTAGPCQVAPIAADQRPQKAKRPGYSVLDTPKLSALLGKKPRPWPQALRDFLCSGRRLDTNG
ncbi:sugar nucleotide-binding protein [Candidatus Desulfovibrio trichonymphae]|uniref:sugar nucleotide-binding protein n=1 Tax=Candidatus Desulfovibrio trichonymphae TaxID=1725232 RepID=UPI001E461992|nr:sugar nucleotide-binding protein [Candidatus Desulfovibrio trichonymphae]GHU98647.1 hypothetical protein AGMMS50248_05540 [Deltaproteobacteria bacterium]